MATDKICPLCKHANGSHDPYCSNSAHSKADLPVFDKLMADVFNPDRPPSQR